MTNKQRFQKLQPVWDALEKLHWRVITRPESINDKYSQIELENWSPAGEDLLIVFDLDPQNDDIAQQAKDLYENFDINEHVKMWLEADSSGAPNDVEILLTDAKDIEKMYEELSNTVAEVYGSIAYSLIEYSKDNDVVGYRLWIVGYNRAKAWDVPLDEQMGDTAKNQEALDEIVKQASKMKVEYIKELFGSIIKEKQITSIQISVEELHYDAIHDGYYSDPVFERTIQLEVKE